MSQELPALTVAVFNCLAGVQKEGSYDLVTRESVMEAAYAAIDSLGGSVSVALPTLTLVRHLLSIAPPGVLFPVSEWELECGSRLCQEQWVDVSRHTFLRSAVELGAVEVLAELRRVAEALELSYVASWCRKVASRFD